jgi:hypothetical protein
MRTTHLNSLRISDSVDLGGPTHRRVFAGEHYFSGGKRDSVTPAPRAAPGGRELYHNDARRIVAYTVHGECDGQPNRNKPRAIRAPTFARPAALSGRGADDCYGRRSRSYGIGPCTHISSTCWSFEGLAGSMPSSTAPVGHVHPAEQLFANTCQAELVYKYVHVPRDEIDELEELEELEPFIRMPFGGIPICRAATRI